MDSWQKGGVSQPVCRQPLRGPACTDEEEGGHPTTHGLGRVLTCRQPLRGPACTDEEEGGHHTTHGLGRVLTCRQPLRGPPAQMKRRRTPHHSWLGQGRQPLRGPPAQMKRRRTPHHSWLGQGRQPLRGPPAQMKRRRTPHHSWLGQGRQPLRGPPAQMKRRRTPHHSWLGQGRQPLRGPACTDEEEGGHHTTHGLGRVLTRRQPLRGPPAQMKREEDTTPLMAWAGFSHVGIIPSLQFFFKLCLYSIGNKICFFWNSLKKTEALFIEKLQQERVGI
ncbi:unnamed protein product [Mytilus edulis]|uniref:Uncharacterized protein n=1 Tax=Mytilus edulis TaxID=6550 RepID=A0A8S3S977_MYTED|nr:unnamed protein product [Mytilus edulis]